MCRHIFSHPDYDRRPWHLTRSADPGVPGEHRALAGSPHCVAYRRWGISPRRRTACRVNDRLIVRLPGRDGAIRLPPVGFQAGTEPARSCAWRGAWRRGLGLGCFRLGSGFGRLAGGFPRRLGGGLAVRLRGRVLLGCGFGVRLCVQQCVLFGARLHRLLRTARFSWARPRFGHGLRLGLPGLGQLLLRLLLLLVRQSQHGAATRRRAAEAAVAVAQRLVMRPSSTRP